MAACVSTFYVHVEEGMFNEFGDEWGSTCWGNGKKTGIRPPRLLLYTFKTGGG